MAMLHELRLNTLGLTGSLLDLAPVNFLVGANGSGKTRILRSLGLTIPHPPGPLAALPFSGGDGVDFEPNQVGYVSAFLTLSPYNVEPPTMEEYSEACEKLGQRKPIRQTIPFVRNSGLGLPIDSTTEQTEVWTHDGLQVVNSEGRLDRWSGGTMLMASLIQALNFAVVSGLYSDVQAMIVGVEEPETGLHPKAHRELVEMFLDASQTGVVFNDPMNGTRRVPVQFFITTHSPSLIAAAAKKSDTKIYVLDERLLTLQHLPKRLEDFMGVNHSARCSRWKLSPSSTPVPPDVREKIEALPGKGVNLSVRPRR